MGNGIEMSRQVIFNSRFSIFRGCASKPFSESNVPQIAGVIREIRQKGSRKSRELRKDRVVPGVLYGVDEDKNVIKILVGVNEKDLLKELRLRGRSFENTIYELALSDNSRHIVTPRQIQFNPLTGSPMSVNFLKYWPGNRVRIPLEYINEDQSLDLRRGCFLVPVNKFVECVCSGDVPSTIPVDLAGVQKGDVIRLGNLSLPPNVRPSSSVPADFVAAVIRSGRTK